MIKNNKIHLPKINRRIILSFHQYRKWTGNRGKLLLVKLRASACNFTKTNTPPWVFVPNRTKHIILITSGSITVNSLNDKVAIVERPVNWFAPQIN